MKRVVAARLFTSHVIEAGVRCTHDYSKCGEQVVDGTCRFRAASFVLWL